MKFLKQFHRTLEEVLARQQFISAIISNKKQIRSIASIKRDIEEAYRFSDSIVQTHQEFFEKKMQVIILRLSFDKNFRSSLVSNAAQLGNVLKAIHERYFLLLKTENFTQQQQTEIADSLVFLHKLSGFYNTEGFTTCNLPQSKYLHFLKLIVALNREMEVFWKYFFKFDAYVSIATSMEARSFCMPSFQERGITIHDIFHPLLTNPVKNSVTTNAGIVLLTGANMSGKSTFLKSLALCVYLARLGLGVPASQCIVPYFDNIFVNIYSKDNLQSGLSHFMSELNVLKSAALSAEKGLNTFAVMDELFAGTNTQDAEALLQLTIEGLQKYTNSLFVISTHYTQLKEFVANRPQLTNCFYLDATLEDGFPRFTYRLTEGWSNHKFGMMLFEREGLKKLLQV